MANVTIDATLAVEATSLEFPATFPWFFGPDAAASLDFSTDAPLAVTATTVAILNDNMLEFSLAVTASTDASASVDGHMDAPLDLAVGFDALIGMFLLADASLIVTTHDTFPYTFPFVFEASPDNASRGQSLNAATAASAAFTGTARRGAVADVAQPITASFFASGISGGEHLSDVAFTATATAAATMSQNHITAASLAALANKSAHLVAALHASAHQGATVSNPAAVHWQAQCSAPLVATAAIESMSSLQAMLNAHATALATFLVASGRHQYADVELEVLATADVSNFHDVTAGAALAVQAHTTVTVPEPTGFWNFYLR